MPEDNATQKQRFSLLLDEYIGFVNDLHPNDPMGFMGHFQLEIEINAVTKSLGFDAVFTRSDKYLGGFDWVEQKQSGTAQLCVHRPRQMGCTMYYLPLRPTLQEQEKVALVGILREWQRAAPTLAANDSSISTDNASPVALALPDPQTLKPREAMAMLHGITNYKKLWKFCENTGVPVQRSGKNQHAKIDKERFAVAAAAYRVKKDGDGGAGPTPYAMPEQAWKCIKDNCKKTFTSVRPQPDCPACGGVACKLPGSSNKVSTSKSRKP